MYKNDVPEDDGLVMPARDVDLEPIVRRPRTTALRLRREFFAARHARLLPEE